MIATLEGFVRLVSIVLVAIATIALITAVFLFVHTIHSNIEIKDSDYAKLNFEIGLRPEIMTLAKELGQDKRITEGEFEQLMIGSGKCEFLENVLPE